MSRKFFDRVTAGNGYSSRRYESPFAIKMMQKMGWKKGEGLGKKLQGRKDCIQVKKRADNEGLGFGQKIGQKKKIIQNGVNINDGNWWSNLYDKTLKVLTVTKGGDSDKEEQKEKKMSKYEKLGKELKDKKEAKKAKKLRKKERKEKRRAKRKLEKQQQEMKKYKTNKQKSLYTEFANSFVSKNVLHSKSKKIQKQKYTNDSIKTNQPKKISMCQIAKSQYDLF